MNEKKYYQHKEAAEILGISRETLKRWGDAGKIQYYKAGEKGSRFRRRYCLDEFIGIDRGKNTIDPKKRRSICYARVSSRHQKDDLERQKEYLKNKYPNHEVITDIGSGLNFKRKGLKTILDFAYKGEIEELVVAHKDRLCRFGFELVENAITECSQGKIVVLNNHKSSPHEELTTDLLAILTVFSARSNGLRKYKNKIEDDPDIPKQKTKTDTSSLDGNGEMVL